MAEYKYDIFFVEEKGEGGETQVYLFNGPHSFFENENANPFFKAEVEHLEPRDNELNRVRLKFKISRKP